MGLFLPQPPPVDSDEEDDPEEAAACRSRASIPMDDSESPSFLMLIHTVLHWACGVKGTAIPKQSVCLSRTARTPPRV